MGREQMRTGAPETTVQIQLSNWIPPGDGPAAPVPPSIEPACSSCDRRQLCLPVGLSTEDFRRIDDVISTRRNVGRGSALFVTGEPFHSLYAIRSGSFKTYVSAQGGNDQVTGFQLAGEILGLGGIVSERQSCNAVALENAQVCVIPFGRIEELARHVGALQHHVHRLLSGEIVREHGVMVLLGSMRAEERVAAFLLNLAGRLHARGLPHSEFLLRMTREEIGSYLGLKLETVSRTFSRFADQGLLEVRRRHVRILDQTALQRIASQPASDP